ncbi:MAG: sodium-dependent transporter [Oscillospiraceae bacterium]|nr:sodium-dependent transporter [Oscillospiraceae bacterium]MBR6596317.1 sodium-dependent transporter [Oscillospiraceae bacterium]
MQREHLGSRLGFILLSAGCAIGIGNVWKFPYITGQNGGAIFVLIYLACLVLLGLPVMVMEFAMGRAAQKSPARMYQELQPKGSKWHIHGYVALLGNYMLLMCYTTIAGWMIQYFVDTASGKFVGLDPTGISNQFGAMIQNDVSMAFYATLVTVLALVVCSFSLQKGLERITKWMMLALLSIMLLLAVNSCLLEGAAEGLKFYLLPSWDRFIEAGIGNVIVAAMNQSFFSLSLGIGAMAIFGSYLKKERTLMGEAVNVVCLDTFVAFTAGLIIFPACSAYGVEANSGPNLIFITLPNIFNNMPLGRLWGSLFFVFMSFAALSTVFAVFENIVACTRDMFGWERKKACLINGVAIIILALPCVLGFTVLSNVQILGLSIMDFEDFAVNNILLPVGSLIFALFCVSRYGWGWEKFKAEANEGAGLKVAEWMRPYMTFVVPTVIVFIFIYGLVSFFS